MCMGDWQQMAEMREEGVPLHLCLGGLDEKRLLMEGGQCKCVMWRTDRNEKSKGIRNRFTVGLQCQASLWSVMRRCEVIFIKGTTSEVGILGGRSLRIGGRAAGTRGWPGLCITSFIHFIRFLISLWVYLRKIHGEPRRVSRRQGSTFC